MSRFLKSFQLAALLVFCYSAHVTEASAAPRAITSCRTITLSGSYILTKNLDAVGNCLVIEADNVTIDLDGYTISGDGTGIGITDGGAGRKNIAIRNGVITNFEAGVGLSFLSSGCVVERVRASQNSVYGIVAGRRAIVRDCIASGNGNIGIFGMMGSLITGNVAFDNGTTGLYAEVGVTLSNNSSSLNTTGILAVCPSNVIGNTATNNTSSNYAYAGVDCGNNQNVPAAP
jgi:hypothetical protein